MMAMTALWSSSTSVRGFAAAFSADIWKEALQTKDNQSINLAVSLIWSGNSINDFNLAALEKFRKRFSDIPFIHFISPAYFSRGNEESITNLNHIRTVVREGDRIGLLLSGWKSYIVQSGLIFRHGPTFWGSSINELECKSDCGSDIPIHIYPMRDLEKLIATGIKSLTNAGFAAPIAIRTNGFVSNQSIMQAAVNRGIFLDFSAIPPSVLQPKFHQYPLYSWINNLWNGVKYNTTPYARSMSENAITIVPQSLGAIDYHTPKQVETIFKRYINSSFASNKKPNKTFTMSLHQSTANREIPKMVQSLQSIFAISVNDAINLVPLALPGSTFSDEITFIPMAISMGPPFPPTSHPIADHSKEILEKHTH